MSDTPKTDKAEKLALELTKELTWDCVVAGEAGIRQIARECRKFERENAALREALKVTTERLSHHVRLPVPVAPGLYATSAEEKASLEVLVKAWEVLYPKAQP